MNKKYEFTGETKEFNGRKLQRIKRIEDGLVGGWIESERNLSHEGNCFVYDNAMVFDDAGVYNNAEICGCAEIFGDAKIYEGRIIGQICQPYKGLFQCRCKNRILTAILTEDNEILYAIGCQNNITKKQFLDRIYNKDGGLEENPHRKEYLKLIPLIEQYFKN